MSTPARGVLVTKPSVTHARPRGFGCNATRPPKRSAAHRQGPRTQRHITRALDRDTREQTQTQAQPLSNRDAPNRTTFSDLSFTTLTRGQVVRKDVVTRTGGTRLGNVSQLWVDTDGWEVVALDCRPAGTGVFSPVVNAVGGGRVDHILMSSLRQVGDVVLVHDENAVERRWSSYGLQTVVGCDVVTERGTYIGRVRDFEFDPEDGLVQRLIVDALGLPIVPEQVVSTYAIDVREILSSGMDRIIVADGAESRVEQLSSSLLQRLQLSAPPWEDDLAVYGDYYANEYYARNTNNEYAPRTSNESQPEERSSYARQERDSSRSSYARELGNQRERFEWEQRQGPGSRSRQTRDDPYERRDEQRDGIPLVRPNQQFERKDADGGYGERPGVAGADRPSVAFNDYLEQELREYEYEYDTGGEGTRCISQIPPPWFPIQD